MSHVYREKGGLPVIGEGKTSPFTVITMRVIAVKYRTSTDKHFIDFFDYWTLFLI